MTRDVKTGRPDAELARLVAVGDAAAFEELHGRYRGYVYGIALRMTGNEADAEDLTQESFVSVLRWVGSFRGEASFSTWLYRLVVNHVKMHFRYRSRRPEAPLSEGEVLEYERGGARRADSKQVTDRLAIEETVRRLPPGYRAAFVLYDVCGFDHEEIAVMTGRKAGTSKSQVFKARLCLRKMLSARRPALQS